MTNASAADIATCVHCFSLFVLLDSFKDGTALRYAGEFMRQDRRFVLEALRTVLKWWIVLLAKGSAAKGFTVLVLSTGNLIEAYLCPGQNATALPYVPEEPVAHQFSWGESF